MWILLLPLCWYSLWFLHYQSLSIYRNNTWQIIFSIYSSQSCKISVLLQWKWNWWELSKLICLISSQAFVPVLKDFPGLFSRSSFNKALYLITNIIRYSEGTFLVLADPLYTFNLLAFCNKKKYNLYCLQGLYANAFIQSDLQMRNVPKSDSYKEVMKHECRNK